MHRYIAFVWNHQIAEKTSLVKVLARRLKSTFPGWECALDTEGLQTYYKGGRGHSPHSYQLNHDAGVVLGKLFQRRTDIEGGLHEAALNEKETQKVKETEGRHLVDHYWGGYVALLREEDGRRVRILRDPTGAMPCLLTNFRGIYIICSDIDDCMTLGLVNSAINWDHMAAYLLNRRLVTKDTGLDGVQQIHAGECITIGASCTTATFYWTPDRIHGARVVEDRQQAVRELRAVIQYCVETWASAYNRILHGLSGGLDSAVVLACLSSTSSKANLVCENYFTQDARGDERVFAQKAASRAKVELIQTPIRARARTLDSMLDSKKLATPTLTHLVPETTLLREEFIGERNIDAVFSGQGGDHFFQQNRTPLIAADYAWRHGLRPELFSVIEDTARFTRKSVWSVMATVFAVGVLRRHVDPYTRILPSPLVSEATRDAVDLNRIRHPWVDSAAHLPSNKLQQIFNIVDSQLFYNERSHCADTVHPLISQPIIELCLQIPSYVLTYGGIDRALVRDAFSGMMPSEITGRTNKGGTTSALSELLVRNLPFLQEFLLDGLLVREGMLDREKIEASLTESELIRDRHLLSPMLDAILGESWLSTWLGEGRRAAA